MYAAASSRASSRDPSSFAKQIASGSRPFPTRPVFFALEIMHLLLH